MQPHRNAAAWLGVALIGAALALLDKGKHFPGWWALLPTVGTAMLLAAGPQAWFNRRVLSHKVLVPPVPNRSPGMPPPAAKPPTPCAGCAPTPGARGLPPRCAQ